MRKHLFYRSSHKVDGIRVVIGSRLHVKVGCVELRRVVVGAGHFGC